MARIEIAAQSWGVVQDRAGNVRSGIPFTLTAVGGGAVTRYTTVAGSTPETSTTTNANGEIPGFIDAASYILTVGGVTRQVEASLGGTGPGPQGPAGAAGATGAPGPVGPSWPLVTTLPSSPVNGDECYYVADATNGVVWHLKYRSADASAYKWQVVGGGALTNIVANDVATGPTASYGDIATVGPKVTVPLAGDYLCDMGAVYLSGSGSGSVSIGLMVNGAQPASNDRIAGGPQSTATVYSTVARAGVRVASLTAGDIVKVGYLLTSANSVNINGRSLTACPVRVG